MISKYLIALVLLCFVFPFAHGQAVAVSGDLHSTGYQSKPVIDVRDQGFVAGGVTDNTTAANTLITAIGTAPTTLYIPATYLLGAVSFPANVTLDFAPGGTLKCTTSSTVTILGGINDPGMNQIFTNCLGSQGTADLTGNLVVQRVYPEWWGAVAGGTATNNLAAIQAAIYGAFGCGPTACRTNASGNSKWNRELHFNGMYDINGELKLYHVIGFMMSGENKLLSGIRQTAVNSRIFDGQSVAYGYVSNLSFATNASQNVPLVELDYSGAQGSDLRPQNVTFQDVLFGGGGLGYIGLQISKSGSSAQGDNIRCLYCYGSGFTQAAIQSGSSTTFAQNAMLVDIHGGDYQSNPQYAIAIYGGSANISSVSFENGTVSQTGSDVLCQAGQFPCVIDNVRSESAHLASGASMRIRNSSTTWGATQWDWPANLAGTVATANQLISGSSGSGVGAYFYVTVPGTWGGLNLTNATSGSATTIACSGCSWGVNTFQNQRVSIINGTGRGETAVITSNTATTITVPNWNTTPFAATFRYYHSGIAPDNTSQFVVEPNWGTQTTSGTVTFAAVPGYAIAGDVNAGVPTAGTDISLDNVVVNGLQIFGGGHFKNVIVTRTDWMVAPPYNFLDTNDSYENVQALLPVYGGVPQSWVPMAWSFPRNAISVEANNTSMFSQKLCWGVGAFGGGAAANDTCIGGRSDPGATSDVFRSRLELFGMLGTAVPSGLNQNGNPTQIGGGPPTGSGTPGNIEFWESSGGGGSGSTPQTGAKVASVTPAGFQENSGNIGFLGGKGQHFTTQAASNDLVGTLATSSSTTASVTFTTNYTATPVCVLTPQTTGLTSWYLSAISASGFTVTVAPSGTYTFGYICMGNPK